MNTFGQIKAKQRRQERAKNWELKNIFGDNIPEKKSQIKEAVYQLQRKNAEIRTEGKKPGWKSNAITPGFLARIEKLAGSPKAHTLAVYLAQSKINKAVRHTRKFKKPEKQIVAKPVAAAVAPAVAPAVAA